MNGFNEAAFFISIEPGATLTRGVLEFRPRQMVRFLFWNVHGKRLDDLIAEMASVHDVDLIVLVEYPVDPFPLLERLNRDAGFRFSYAPTLSRVATLYTRFPPEFLRAHFDSSRITIQRLSLPARVDVIIAVVHFPSKLFWSDESQAFECTKVSQVVRGVETSVGHSRTVLVGDFNMNPFEKGMVAAIGLNATMARKIAARNSRIVQTEEYPFFYNPMWNHLGDERASACGTFYRDSGEHVNYYWNLFDQVLVRPALLQHLPNDAVHVLTSAAERSLLTDAGTPSTAVASDHLPLLFALNL